MARCSHQDRKEREGGASTAFATLRRTTSLYTWAREDGDVSLWDVELKRVMMRYLFLCGEGWKRSPTAVTVARELAARRGLSIEAESGGIAHLRPEAVPHLLKRYDAFVVMERYMQDELVRRGVPRTSIVCLGIPDRYERNDQELVKILEKKLATVVR